MSYARENDERTTGVYSERCNRSGGGWRGRFGVKRGHIGVGFDYEAGFFKIRGDYYDPNDPHFDIIAEHITKYSTEILVSRVRQKAPRISQHTNKPAQKSHI